LCGGHSKLKLSGKRQSELNLSGNGNECKPLMRKRHAPVTAAFRSASTAAVSQMGNTRSMSEGAVAVSTTAGAASFAGAFGGIALC